MINELERTWKETVKMHTDLWTGKNVEGNGQKALSQNLSEGNEENLEKTWVRIVCVQAKIRSRHLPNINQKLTSFVERRYITLKKQAR
jgi:hypothetical protein